MEDTKGSLNQLYKLGFYHIAAKCAIIAAEKKLDVILAAGNTMPIKKVADHLKFSLPGTIKFLRVLDAFELVEMVDANFVKATPLTNHLDYFLGTHISAGYKVHENLATCLQTGEPCWEDTYGENFYAYVSSWPGELERFAAWCKKTADFWLKVVTTLYDFSAFAKIADIGGSTGELILHLLNTNQQQTGILFDLPDVITDAEKSLQDNPAMKRLELVGGDFFGDLPPEADLYILSRVLLNWSDANAVRIINNCFDTMQAYAKLLIVDLALDKDDPSYEQAALSDMNLFALTGSSNRTKAEWLALIARTKFGTCTFKQTTPEVTAKYQLLMPICCIELQKPENITARH